MEVEPICPETTYKRHPTTAPTRAPRLHVEVGAHAPLHLPKKLKTAPTPLPINTVERNDSIIQ